MHQKVYTLGMEEDKYVFLLSIYTKRAFLALLISVEMADFKDPLDSNTMQAKVL